MLGHEMIELTTAQQADLDQLIEQRNQGRPISRMRGRREFYSLTYYLNDHTLDPRPDSECLIDEALAYARSLSAERRPLRCLDLGTGTGCLLLSLLYHLPAATGLGVDLAPQAVAQARANAASLGLSGRTRFICSHWLDKGVKHMFEGLFNRYQKVWHGAFRHVCDVKRQSIASQFKVVNTLKDGSQRSKTNCNFFELRDGLFCRIEIYMSGENTLT